MSVCRFCGQDVIVEDGKPDIPELACNCSGAKKWRYREEIKTGASEKIENLFGESGKDGFTAYGDVPVPEEDRDLLKYIVPFLMDGYVKSVKMDVPNICSCTIKMSGEKIKVSRKQSKTVQEEV